MKYSVPSTCEHGALMVPPPHAKIARALAADDQAAASCRRRGRRVRRRSGIARARESRAVIQASVRCLTFDLIHLRSAL